MLLLWMIMAIFATYPGSMLHAGASALPQTDPASQKAAAMLEQMTPEERVGQLFLVTFQGSTFDENSQIYQLIAQHHVGGVVLQRSNDNFSQVNNILGQTYALNRLLQEAEYKASQAGTPPPGSDTSVPPQYIPLLIGVSQQGDNSSDDQILSGLSALPDLMSIGATWDPSMAKKVGAVLGQELSALGFNLFLGPSLDVLQSSVATSTDTIGVQSFGGSAYWVGRMGQQYIAGLHEGSSNRMMVVAKDFPGRGAADRAPDAEIATVRKSLDQLKQVDLAPYFAVTGNASDETWMADGMMVSHIRYQGVQGNIRTTTRPISADAQALDQLMKLQSLSQWRTNNGVLVSDDLGSQAVRRFYDPTGVSFDARTAAREAFFAGNDLLYTDRFIGTNDPDTFTTIVRTLDFFVQKYREDESFAQRVNASVLRILTQKYQLYPNFNFNLVVPSEAALADIGRSQQVSSDVAQRAVTLISPDANDLLNVLPRGPQTRDRVVFLTDVQPERQCSACEDQVTMQADALQTAVLRLYGPRAGGQASQNLMSSYSFGDLLKILNGSSTGAATEEPNALANDLKLADWVVVSMVKPRSDIPESYAFRRLLSERFDLVNNKKIVVFAFDGPGYLDATDISKLTAYYGLYSKISPFVDTAARVLYQELAAPGNLPVTVSGVGYDVLNATMPDPTQVIQMIIDNNPSSSTTRTVTSTQEPTAAPVIRVGDVLSLRTGVIEDHNQNPVPDGTQVSFVFSLLSSESSGSTQQSVDTVTVDGIARATYRINRPGLLEIHAVSMQNTMSSLLRLDITSGISAGVTLIAATPQPTSTLVPTPTATITAMPTETATPVPVASVHFQDWFFAALITFSGALVVVAIGIRRAFIRWGLRWALCGVIGGLLFYNYLALRLPGSQALLNGTGTPGVLLVTMIGIFIGWGAGVIWRQVSLVQTPSRPTGDRGSASSTGPKSQSN